jgi:hypothetical protein
MQRLLIASSILILFGPFAGSAWRGGHWFGYLGGGGAAYEFLFVLGQPRFVGAVPTVINPVAIK